MSERTDAFEADKPGVKALGMSLKVIGEAMEEQRSRRALERISRGDAPVADPSNYAEQGIRHAWQEAEVHREYAAHVLGGGDPEVGHGYGVKGTA